MKNIKSVFAFSTLISLLSVIQVFASPVAYTFRATDNYGTLVPGATIAVGSTVLSSSASTTVPQNAGEKVLGTGIAPSTTVSVNLIDYGTGDYALVYDATANGEMYFPIAISKTGNTITGSAALVSVCCSADSSAILIAGSQTTPNNQQANVTAGLTSVGLTNARSAKLDNLTGLVIPTNFGTLSINQSGAITTSNPGGGSSITEASIINAFKADSVLSRTYNRAFGKYAYNQATHIMSLLKDDGSPQYALDGVTPVTITLGYDAATNVITSKQ